MEISKVTGQNAIQEVAKTTAFPKVIEEEKKPLQTPDDQVSISAQAKQETHIPEQELLAQIDFDEPDEKSLSAYRQLVKQRVKAGYYSR